MIAPGRDRRRRAHGAAARSPGGGDRGRPRRRASDRDRRSDHQAPEEATKHLLELGHETVFHITGPHEWMQTQERITGWRTALGAGRRRGHHAASLATGARVSGYEAGRMLARIPELSAVFVAQRPDDARPLARALRTRTIRSPATSAWSVSTTFPRRPSSHLLSPPSAKTSRKSGRQALQMLLAQIEAGSPLERAPHDIAPSSSSERARAPPEAAVTISLYAAYRVRTNQLIEPGASSTCPTSKQDPPDATSLFLLHGGTMTAQLELERRTASLRASATT